MSYLDPVVKMKWNTSNISLCLQVYQQFPTLWNIKDKDYSNKSLRDASFKRLISELKENQLGEMDAKLLKSKSSPLKMCTEQNYKKLKKAKRMTVELIKFMYQSYPGLRMLLI